MWLWIFILFLSGSSYSDPPPNGLEKEFEDVVKLNKYAPTTRKLVTGILKAIQIYDCYDNMVKGKRTGWNIGSELSTAAFDALRGLRKTENEFTTTISASLIQLKSLQTTLLHKPDIVEQIDAKHDPCFMGGKMYTKDDCEECRKSIPGFKSKANSMTELRDIVLAMQSTIPKQFMYYANDIFVIVAEAIRIIDKMWSCLTSESDVKKCESRDKSIQFFTKRMGEIAVKENDHAKMVAAERIKLNTIVAQLAQEVGGSMDGMTSCLQIRSGISSVDLWKEGNAQLNSATVAKNVGIDLDKTNATDTKRVIESLPHEAVTSVGSKVAKGQ